MDSLPAEVVEIIIEYVEDAYMEGPLESYGVPFLAMVNRRFCECAVAYIRETELNLVQIFRLASLRMIRSMSRTIIGSC